MRRWPRPVIVLSAIGIGIFEVVGSFGAAHNTDTGRKGMDALAIVLVLLGPLALAVRDRWPLGCARRDARVGGRLRRPRLRVRADLHQHRRGPDLRRVAADRRRGAWLLAGVGYVGFVVAGQLDPRAPTATPGWSSTPGRPAG